MNDKANAQAMTGNANTTTMANDENLAADRAKAAVNRLILRRQGRMMPIAIGVGLFLGTLAATAVFLLEKYDYLIFRNGGRHQIVIDGRRIDLGISPENLDRIRSFAAEIENISYAVIVTAVLLATLWWGRWSRGRMPPSGRGPTSARDSRAALSSSPMQRHLASEPPRRVRLPWRERRSTG